MSSAPAPVGQREAGFCEFETRLVYRVRPRTVRVTQLDSVSTKPSKPELRAPIIVYHDWLLNTYYVVVMSHTGLCDS